MLGFGRNFKATPVFNLVRLQKGDPVFNLMRNTDWQAIATVLARNFGADSSNSLVNMRRADSVPMFLKFIDWNAVANIMKRSMAFYDNAVVAEVEELKADDENNDVHDALDVSFLISFPIS